MKKLISTAFVYACLSIFASVFYRRFVEYHHFTGETTLKYLQTFIMLMGVALFLIVAIFEANYKICSDKHYIYFSLLYHLSLVSSIVAMFIRGILQVYKVSLMQDSLTALIFALVCGYVGITTGIIMLFNIIRRNAKNDSILNLSNYGVSTKK